MKSIRHVPADEEVPEAPGQKDALKVPVPVMKVALAVKDDPHAQLRKTKPPR